VSSLSRRRMRMNRSHFSRHTFRVFMPLLKWSRVVPQKQFSPQSFASCDAVTSLGGRILPPGNAAGRGRRS
jgi:hypothetical protein